jgi:hypothetical protein
MSALPQEQSLALSFAASDFVPRTIDVLMMGRRRYLSKTPVFKIDRSRVAYHRILWSPPHFKKTSVDIPVGHVYLSGDGVHGAKFAGRKRGIVVLKLHLRDLNAAVYRHIGDYD